MQYLLTHDEYTALRKRADERTEAERASLMAVCMELACHAGGCVRRRREGHRTMGYCDDCPAEKWCPYEAKEWSK